MSNYVTGFHTKDGVKKYDYNALANLPEAGTDITNTVISPNADYAEVGEWADGNPSGEDRLGYFVAIAEVGDNTIKIRKATPTDDVRGVSVYNPAFSGNASKNKYGADGELLPQYNYIGVMGIVSVIDNYRCEVGGRCMPSDDGTAIPSGNNMGYAVLERVDTNHVLIAVEPGADMIQRVKADVKAIEDQLKSGGSGGSGGGVSPTVDVTPITGGHKVTITDAIDTEEFNVMNGQAGATFIPSVSADGELSWTNNGGLGNPEKVNIKGRGITKTEINTDGELVITYTDGNSVELGKVVGEGGGGSGGGLTNEQLTQLNALVKWYNEQHYKAMTGTFTSSLSSSTYYEVGSSQSVTFSWSFDKKPSTLTFTPAGGTAENRINSITEVTNTDGTISWKGSKTITVTSKTAQGLEYKIHAEYKDADLDKTDVVDKKITFTFCFKRYYGYAEKPATESDSAYEALVKNLTHKALATSRKITFKSECPDGQYVWVAYQTGHGKASFETDYQKGCFEDPKTVPVTNDYNITQNYYVYRSINPGIRGFDDNPLNIYVT